MAAEAAPRPPQACAVQNTVVGTVASLSFLPGLMQLASTAAAVGFPCIVVQPFDWFDALRDERLVPLEVPSPPLLPRTVWCNEPSMRHQYGWRRSQLYRARLWRVVLERNLDLLAMDLDHQMAVTMPLPLLRSVHAPPEKVSHLAIPPASKRAAPADVVAVWDGPGSRYLNVGIMWVRSTVGTRELARRSENRSFVGWEQQVFNEELNFNPDLVGVRCCHTICLKRITTASGASKRLPAKSDSGTSMRQHSEGRDRCDDNAPSAAAPPAGSTEPWAAFWTPNADVLRSKHSIHRKYGRCNHPENVCVMVEAESGMVSHMASTHGSPEAPPSNCTVPAGSAGS